MFVFPASAGMIRHAADDVALRRLFPAMRVPRQRGDDPIHARGRVINRSATLSVFPASAGMIRP